MSSTFYELCPPRSILHFVCFILKCVFLLLKNISDEKFEQLFDALPENEHLEVLSLTNVGLTDRTALLLSEAIEKNKTLRVLNVETNFISPAVIVNLVRALLKAKSIEEFRASNQVWIYQSNNIQCKFKFFFLSLIFNFILP